MTLTGHQQVLTVVYVTCLLSFLLVSCNKAPSPAVKEETERFPTSPTSLPTTALTFEDAKRWLYQRVYFDHRKTFYCGCDYAKAAGSAGEIDLASCGVVLRQDPERARRLEVEHVLPAARFGNFRPCWRDVSSVCGKQMSGRQCCEQADPVFR